MWALVQSVPFNLAPATETIEGIVYKEPIPIANKVSFKNNEPHHSNHCLCYSCVPLPLLFKPTSAVYLENCKQAHQATYSNPLLKGKDLLKKTQTQEHEFCWHPHHQYSYYQRQNSQSYNRSPGTILQASH